MKKKEERYRLYFEDIPSEGTCLVLLDTDESAIWETTIGLDAIAHYIGVIDERLTEANKRLEELDSILKKHHIRGKTVLSVGKDVKTQRITDLAVLDKELELLSQYKKLGSLKDIVLVKELKGE